jgi:hypothetical protein
MASVRTYSGRNLRSRWKGFVGTNIRLILLVVIFEIAALGSVTSILIKAYGTTPLVTYILGLLHATICVMLYFALRTSFWANDQDAIYQMRGDLGETNTRGELRRAKRRRLIWGWVDSIAVSGGDIDHLVVTRRGGVVAIDSKWRSRSHRDDIARSAVAAEKAAGRARSVLRHLGYFKREHSARRRAAANDLTVTPLVSLWGAIRNDVPAAARVDNVDFIAGPDLLSWLRQHRSDDVSRKAAKRLLRELEAFRRQHQPPETPRDTFPPTTGARVSSKRNRTTQDS